MLLDRQHRRFELRCPLGGFNDDFDWLFRSGLIVSGSGFLELQQRATRRFQVGHFLDHDTAVSQRFLESSGFEGCLVRRRLSMRFGRGRLDLGRARRKVLVAPVQDIESVRVGGLQLDDFHALDRRSGVAARWHCVAARGGFRPEYRTGGGDVERLGQA